MNLVYLGIGSNIYPRIVYIYQALYQIEKRIGYIRQRSSVYQTKPWNMPADTAFFYNLCICVHTSLKAEEILDEIYQIERELGRIKTGLRKGGYESRTIDIDILLFNTDIIQSEKLVVPHPHLHEREFVLQPLTEIAGDKEHPVFKKKIKDLLECSTFV